MGTTREQAVGLVNDAKLCADGNEKVGLLKSLRELVVHKDPDLLLEFLPEVALFTAEPSSAVKKAVAEFVEAAADATRSPDLLSQCVRCLSSLLADSVGSVVKSALMAGTAVFRKGFDVVRSQGSLPVPTDNLPTLWSGMQAMSAGVAGLSAAGVPQSDSVRVAATRFGEQAALLLTEPDLSHQQNKVLTSAQLARMADAHVGQLAALLQGKAFESLPSPLAIVALRSAGAVAAARGQFMGKLLPPLIALANSRKYKVDETSGVQTSVAAALKAALVAALRGGGQQALAWRRKAHAALDAMGAGAAAESAIRHADRQAAKRDRTARRGGGGEPSNGEDGPEPKRSRSSTPINGTAEPAPSTQQQQHQAVAAAQAVAAVAAADGPNQLAGFNLSSPVQVQAIFAALVSLNQEHVVDALLARVAPEVLAEVVLINLQWLPGRQEFERMSREHDQQQQRQQQQAAHPPQEASAPAAPAAPAAAAPPHRPGAAVARQPTPPVPAAAAPKPKAVAPAPPRPIGPVQLLPSRLAPQQMATLRKDAVRRILATHKTPLRDFRSSLLARLAVKAPEGDGLADELLQYMLEDFGAREGLDLALKWLAALFVACQEQRQQQQGSGSTATAAGAAAASRAAAAERVGGPGGEEGEGVPERGVQEGVGPSGGGSSGLAGTTYETVFMALLEGLRERLPPKDRTIAQLLAEAPALPMPAVASYLQDLASGGPEWATCALSAARDVILGRPPDRRATLRFVLHVSTGSEPDLRGKAVRLVANKLFPEPQLTAEIEAYARERLQAMLDDPELRADGGGDGGAAAAAQGDGSGGGDQQPELVERCAALCSLYCALCVKKHGMLRALLEAYGAAPPAGRAALRANAPGLAKTLGAANARLLALTEAPPQGSEELLAIMLGALTESAVPPPALVAACRSGFRARRDARLLAPAVAGMSKAEVSSDFPRLLELPLGGWAGVLHRLLMPQPGAGGGAGLFTPVELLLALHRVNPAVDGVPLKPVMAAVTTCLQRREDFGANTLAAALQQMVGWAPLPQLFMRTVIQSLSAASKLRSFVLSEILAALIGRRVWTDRSQWRGWLVAVAQTAPDSFGLLLQLPPAALEDALRDPKVGKLRPTLAAYAQSPQCAVAVPREVLQLLTVGGGSGAVAT